MFKVRLYLDERQDREHDERCKTFTLIWNGLLAITYQCARLAGVTHQMNRKIIIFFIKKTGAQAEPLGLRLRCWRLRRGLRIKQFFGIVVRTPL